MICTEGKTHKMRQKYLLCTSKLCGKLCNAKYKVEHCLQKDVFKVFSINEHLFDQNDVEIRQKKVGKS